MAGDLIPRGDFTALSARKITEETCKKFGYSVGKQRGKAVQIAPYYDKPGDLVAQHIRGKDKDFSWAGKKKGVQLFGQQLWRTGGKRIVITEGEIDCMTVSQLQGNKWPVVSVPNGAAGARKDIEQNLEFLETYEEIILMFDMDEPGREAVQECAPLFTPGKCKVAHLPMKDANECLLQGKGKEVLAAMWEAKVYRPDGIITFGDIKEQLKKPVTWGLDWPWPTLTKLTYGRRRGELYALGAGTGIGKTDVFTQIIAHTVVKLGLPVALFFLEQQPTETGKRVAGKFAGKRFHVPDAGWTPEELDAAIDAVDQGGKVYFYDHFGSCDWQIIKHSIRFLAHAHGVKDIFLDHLTALAAGAEDERKELEGLMAEMAALAQELGITIYFISHLATPDGKPHEEGGRVMIRHFKGSRAIGFWSHFMFGLERDQQADDEAERNTTTFRILKDRYTGQSTGKYFYLGYDATTGLLVEDGGEGQGEGCPFEPDPTEDKTPPDF